MNWIHSTSPSIILQPPLHICNLSITLAIKLAKVIGDLFESGNSMKVDHFRPASIFSVLSTILERLMYNRLLKFIEECDISCDSQFVFWKFHAAFVAVAIAVTHIEDALQYIYGKYRICVCLNFPKACDTWDHSIFLLLRGIALYWSKAIYWIENSMCCIMAIHHIYDLEHVVSLKGQYLAPCYF